MVEGANRTRKETLSKWILETVPGGLVSNGSAQTQDTPRSQGSSLYKIVYGRLPPIIKQVSTNLPQVRGDEISQQMGKVINHISMFVQ